jgi:hypothetical protein
MLDCLHEGVRAFPNDWGSGHGFSGGVFVVLLSAFV